MCYGTPADPPECNPTVGIDAGVGFVCTQEPASIVGGGDAGDMCILRTTESCTDGTTYTASCTFPDEVCTCSELSRNMGGSSGGGVTFKGPPNVCGLSLQSPIGQSLPALAYETCGFPTPPH
jgi:hypothetical protein